ncbi:hypothetical protein IWX49DRAFT_593442 [Phyllosticta citricarpa]|uniref:uncharacterized protein n=1 Tax=Phyllosticta citriasiana TaxID=595635 RepID=UPI0030FD9EB0
MSRHSYALLMLLAVLSLFSTVFAASPASFCKCTCFTNSSIIQLNGLPSSTYSKTGSNNVKDISDFLFERDHERRATKTKHRERTCNDCNRQFCLNYNLPICKGAKEEDVFTECFQRDSAKDQAVVLIFIIATAGLLIYAALRPYIEQWREKANERRTYIPVSTHGDQ